MTPDLLLSALAQTLRISVPYGLAAVGGALSERGGVINIALEGILLLGALGYVLGAHFTGSAWAGLAAAAFTGLAVALVHAFVTVTCRADQITSSLGINLAALGLSRFVLKEVFGSSSNSSRVAGLPQWHVPVLGDIPFVGPLFGNPLILLAAGLIAGAHVLLFRTPFGLRLRSTGEHPEAAATLGLSVTRLRYAALTLNGMLCGLAGSYLVLAQNAAFVPNMTAGRGFMALAAMIFGKWHPVGAFWACLLFGFLDAAAIRLQGAPLPLVGAVPVQAIQALPYALTVVLLAGFFGRARAPGALGVPYVKEG